MTTLIISSIAIGSITGYLAAINDNSLVAYFLGMLNMFLIGFMIAQLGL